MIKPNFFIVGAPKCGTTAMNDYLSAQPGIFMAKKEIHYFGRDLKMRQQISEEQYLGHFTGAGNAKVIGEASVWYLYSGTAAEEIKVFSPGARILVMLRNPVQVIHSLHSQHLFDGNEDITDFGEAVRLDDERRQGKRLPTSLDFFELPPYLDSVLYADQVQRYLDVFGKENVKVLIFDDFQKGPEASVAEVMRFLGIEASPGSKYNVINPNRQIRYFGLHQFVKKPSAGMKKFIRIIIPVRRVRHLLMKSAFRLNVTHRKRKPMEGRLKKELQSRVAADVQRLEKLIGRDLSAWLR